MSDHDAFLQAILENPDDDAPRLMYADWLTEHGDPRGEFIRIQIELARLEPGGRFEQLKEQEEALLRRHREDWIASVREMASKVEFSRGFISEVTLSPRHFKHAEALFRLTPVQHLVVHPVAGEVRELVRLVSSPVLGVLKGLTFLGTFLNGIALAALAASPHLRNLRRLCCSSTSLGPAEIDELTSGPGLCAIETLVLSYNRLGSEGLKKLFLCGHLGNLEYLNLSSNGIDCGGVEALAESPFLEGLKVLDLSRNQVSDRGVQALTQSRHLTRKTGINLYGNPVSRRVQASVSARFRGQIGF